MLFITSMQKGGDAGKEIIIILSVPQKLVSSLVLETSCSPIPSQLFSIALNLGMVLGSGLWCMATNNK